VRDPPRPHARFLGYRSLLLKARTQRFLSRSLAWLRILPLLTPKTRSNQPWCTRSRPLESTGEGPRETMGRHGPGRGRQPQKPLRANRGRVQPVKTGRGSIPRDRLPARRILLHHRAQRRPGHRFRSQHQPLQGGAPMGAVTATLARPTSTSASQRAWTSRARSSYSGTHPNYFANSSTPPAGSRKFSP
jgi:hypothetical protein